MYRDWVMETTKKIIQHIDPNIKFIMMTRGDSKYLGMTNISSESLERLTFMTNNNTKSNYLYLEDFIAYTPKNNKPLEIAGFTQLMKEVWRDADAGSYFQQNDRQLFKPFNKPFISHLDHKTRISVKEYIEIYSKMVPWAKKPDMSTVKYACLLNPDYDPNCPKGISNGKKITERNFCSTDISGGDCCYGWYHRVVHLGPLITYNNGVCCNNPP
jgi:hypothetical protein